MIVSLTWANDNLYFELSLSYNTQAKREPSSSALPLPSRPLSAFERLMRPTLKNSSTSFRSFSVVKLLKA